MHGCYTRPRLFYTQTQRLERPCCRQSTVLLRIERISVAAVALILAATHRVPAAELPGADRIVQYTVVNQDIAGALSGIAASLGLRADVSASVHGDVHGRLPKANASDMLGQLGALYGFDWYCDGRTLYVSSYGEAQHKMLQLGPITGSELLSTLDTLGISDPRWPVRVSQDGTIALVDGPPRFVALVEQTSEALAARVKVDNSAIKVFRGGAAS